jgi:HAMP domain-containing protein
VEALRRERDRLLREIGRRRRELERSMQRMAETLRASRERLSPILSKHREVELEVHALFAELLSDRKLSKLRRAEVRRLYRSLQSQGLLDVPPSRVDASQAEGTDFEGGELPPGGGYTAPRPEGEEGTRFSLRALFKRLALALHPDRVQHEEEKARRTEAMKEVTRAYETGDLARLIEIEQRWGASSEADSAGEVEAAEKSLERTVAELKGQLRDVLAELRALRRSEPFRAAQNLRRVAATGVDPAEVFVISAERDLDRLSDIKNCLHAFVAGRLSWDDLLSTPSWYADDDEFDPYFEE